MSTNFKDMFRMIVSMNVSHFVKICQVLTILHQLICSRGVTNYGTRCIFSILNGWIPLAFLPMFVSDRTAQDKWHRLLTGQMPFLSPNQWINSKHKPQPEKIIHQPYSILIQIFEEWGIGFLCQLSKTIHSSFIWHFAHSTGSAPLLSKVSGSILK